MRDILARVRGVVATKDLVPVLTHYHIYNGRIQGGNGRVAIDAPSDGVDPDWNFTVPAERFLKAVDACDGDPTLKLTADVLTISKSRFRARLPLAAHDTYPRVIPSGDLLPPNGLLLPVLRLLRRFVGTDASRPWALGVIFQGGYAWATNNIVLARCEVDWDGPDIMIPTEAIDELLRLQEEPGEIRVDEGRITLGLSEGAWLSAILSKAKSPTFTEFAPEIAGEGLSGYKSISKLAEAVEQVAPFCADPKFPVIQFDENGVSTPEGEFSASVAMPVGAPGKFHLEPLTQVLSVANWAAFEQYPAPVPWRGPGIDGLLMGLREGER